MNDVYIYSYPIRADLLSYRCFGDAKISRPKILKGLKPAAKFRIIGKDAQLFLPDDYSVVVYFPELFCKYLPLPADEDYGLPTCALQKKYPWYPRKKSKDRFVYADGWCKAFRRNEGYVRFTGLYFACISCDRLYIPMIQGQCYKAIEELSWKDNRFYRLDGTCEQSMAYMRVASDIVSWIAKKCKGERGIQICMKENNRQTS